MPLKPQYGGTKPRWTHSNQIWRVVRQIVAPNAATQERLMFATNMSKPSDDNAAVSIFHSTGRTVFGLTLYWKFAAWKKGLLQNLHSCSYLLIRFLMVMPETATGNGQTKGTLHRGFEVAVANDPSCLWKGEQANHSCGANNCRDVLQWHLWTDTRLQYYLLWATCQLATSWWQRASGLSGAQQTGSEELSKRLTQMVSSSN
jgi:hypothetical protein